MVISAQDTAAASQPPDPLEVGPTQQPPTFALSISKPHTNTNTKQHLVTSDGVEVAAKSRPWNLRSRNHHASPGLKERPRFSVALTCDEIAEDIFAVTGSLPRRRPRKRPRLVQNQIEMVFPGSWLKEITQELYKVPD